MKGKTKSVLGIILSVSMALSLIVTPVDAAPVNGEETEQREVVEDNAVENGSEVTETIRDEENPAEEKEIEEPQIPETSTKTVTVEENYVAYTVDAKDIDLSDVDVNDMTPKDGVKIDKKDPTITVVEEELENIKVLNEDGETVKLTAEQIQTVLGLYQMYMNQWKENADVLGVQNPFYLSYNDKGEDGLGVLGEMLVLANVSVDDVRSGNYSYDDLTGMIMNFYYGDQLGIKYYGQIIKDKRDAAIAAVKNSGAKTDVQKMLVLNDWIAQTDTFNMSYIMNAGKETPVMVAETPVQHPHYDDVHNTLNEVYTNQLTQQFHDQIYEGIKADLRQKYYENAIWNVVYKATYDQIVNQGGSEETPADETGGTTEPTEPEVDPEADKQAKEAADQFMKENADAIAKDAAGFVEEKYGSELAAQLSAGADEFIKQAESEGVDVDPENNPGVKMTIEQITQQQMETNREIPELQGMTPNEAIPVFADQAAQGLTDGVLGYWGGNQFGALAEGKSVCLGYAKAYTYLIQCIYPEYYGVNGTGTDMTVSANWKEAKDLYYDAEGNLDVNQEYNVDIVRITFQADVTMYGEPQPDFNSDHFWNAVKVDGKWYYVDPCYTDVYSEVMSRDRVETDGYMNHMYFMFSDSTARELYDGNYKEIAGLYENVATHKDYEDAWVSRIKSDTCSDGKAFYYVYDSTDIISMLEDYNNSQNNFEGIEVDEAEYKLVRHAITDSDTGNGDTDYEALIEFNHKENEDDEASVARVYNPVDKKMEESELLTKLYAQHEEESNIYPSIAITTALYNNKLYFNLSNCILSYDLESGEVVLVKEYNSVSAKRDKTDAFGGMAFDIVDNAENADVTVENHPIAAISLKEDGKLYVSIATNFSYISGKDAHNSEDSSSFGYEFEESNYNPDYNNYADTGDYSDEMLEQMGYTREKNDNDEFMWVANFVGTEDMNHLGGSSHTYEAVVMEPSCGRDGYTENRCTTCGASEVGSRVENKDTACEHHYVYFDEEYYTKDSNEKWNTGHCYVCTICGYAINEPVEPKKNSMGGNDDYEERKAEYEKKKAIYDAAAKSAGHTYEPVDAVWSEDSTSVSFTKMECSSVCPERKTVLDCLLNDGTVAVEGLEETAEATITGHEGECTTGTTTIYTATGQVNDYKYTAINKVTQDPGKHSYDGEFVWTEVTDEEGNPTGEYTATATVKCNICDDTHENLEAVVVKDEENSIVPACETAGKNVFKATVTVTNEEDGTEIGSAVDVKEVDLPATGHSYKDGHCEVCGQEEPSVDAPSIESVYSKKQTTVKVTWNKVEGAYGYQLYRSDSIDAAEEDWKLIRTIKGDDVDKFTNEESVQYTNVDLKVGHTYYYKVRAFKLKTGATDENDESSRIYSDFSSVEYMPAAVVFENIYSNATNRVRILWNQVEGSHGYQIWRMNEDGTYSIVKTLGDKDNTLTNNQGATTAYSNTGLEAGKTYTYKMRAFSIFEGGKKVFGAYSDEIKVAVMPETPELSGVSNKAQRVTLTWNTVKGASGYQVWMSESQDGKYSIVKSITDRSVDSYTKYDLKSGSTYSFKIRAYTEIDGKKTFGAFTDAVNVKVK